MPRLVAYPTRTLPAGPKAGSLYATHSAIPMTRNTMASLLSQFLPSFSSMSNAFFHGTLAAGGAGGKAAAVGDGARHTRVGSGGEGVGTAIGGLCPSEGTTGAAANGADGFGSAGVDGGTRGAGGGAAIGFHGFATGGTAGGNTCAGGRCGSATCGGGATVGATGTGGSAIREATGAWTTGSKGAIGAAEAEASAACFSSSATRTATPLRLFRSFSSLSLEESARRAKRSSFSLRY